MTQPLNKAKFKRGFKKWSDDKAIELRKRLGLKPNNHLCAFELCKNLDIPVLEPNDIADLSNSQKEILLDEGKRFWSAASIPIGINNYIIVHNPTHSYPRQQSNLMHELAHILCDHKVPKESQDLGLSGFLRNYDINQENEAEWFGSCLQLPRPALLWALKRNMSMEEIGDHFNASVEMVRYRINVTGVKKQLSYSKRY